MKKISLLIAAAVSCACIMACNNAPEEPVEDTIVEETPVVATPAPVDTVVEAVAEPAPAPKTAAKEEVKNDGTATVSATSSTKVDISKAPAKISGVNKTTTTVDNNAKTATPTSVPTTAPAKVKM